VERARPACGTTDFTDCLFAAGRAGGPGGTGGGGRIPNGHEGGDAPGRPVPREIDFRLKDRRPGCLLSGPETENGGALVSTEGWKRRLHVEVDRLAS